MRAVVDVIKHAPEGARLVPQHIDAMVVPGSGLVKMMAEDEGIDKILVQAGFQWREPGCSMCLGKYKHTKPESRRSVIWVYMGTCCSFLIFSIPFSFNCYRYIRHRPLLSFLTFFKIYF